MYISQVSGECLQDHWSSGYESILIDSLLSSMIGEPLYNINTYIIQTNTENTPIYTSTLVSDSHKAFPTCQPEPSEE